METWTELEDALTHPIPKNIKRSYFIQDAIRDRGNLLDMIGGLDDRYQRLYVTTHPFNAWEDSNDWLSDPKDLRGSNVTFDIVPIRPLFLTYGYVWIQKDLLPQGGNVFVKPLVLLCFCVFCLVYVWVRNTGTYK